MDIQKLVDQAAFSTAATALLYMGDHFDRPFCGLHREIFPIIDDPLSMRVNILAPRGFGKSTLFNVAYAGRHAFYKLAMHIVITSNTYDQAAEHLDTLKQIIVDNEVIHQVFGQLKGDVWREDKIVLSNGVCIRAKGAGQQIRGIKHGRFRPQLILGDDLESAELVRSEERMRNFTRWFYSDLMRSGDKTGEGCKIVVVGTLLSEKALLRQLSKDEHWQTVILEAFDDDYNPTYPEYLNKEQVDKLVDEYRANGLLDVLFQEYRNKTMADENKPFTTFARYSPGDAMHLRIRNGLLRRTMPACVILDPPRTATPKSDYTGTLGVVMDLEVGSIYFEDAERERKEPIDMIWGAMDMADRMNTNVIYVEETGLNKWLTTVMNMVQLKRMQESKNAKIYDIRPLKAVGKKEQRIIKLAPLYRTGMIHHNSARCKDLEDELLAFPYGKYDDLADCAAYAITLTNETAGWAVMPDEFVDPMNPSHSDLSSKPISPGDWNIT